METRASEWERQQACVEWNPPLPNVCSGWGEGLHIKLGLASLSSISILLLQGWRFMLCAFSNCLILIFTLKQLLQGDWWILFPPQQLAQHRVRRSVIVRQPSAHPYAYEMPRAPKADWRHESGNQDRAVPFLHPSAATAGQLYLGTSVQQTSVSLVFLPWAHLPPRKKEGFAE